MSRQHPPKRPKTRPGAGGHKHPQSLPAPGAVDVPVAASGVADTPAQATRVAGPPPEILAPAGDMACALAALAAGADALYLGLKHFSARMMAENFGSSELSRLVELAHTQDARVYVAMNTLLKPGDLDSAWRLSARLARDVRPDGMIVQDLGMVDMARQAGFQGGIFLSTLANITHPAGLLAARAAGAQRVILPRELNIEEIRQMGAACPEGLELECFVHGALCYCVSGRCYWSSYMGGKSGLRGRCVQPCRRLYRQGGVLPRVSGGPQRPRGDTPGERRPRPGKQREGRFFSCLDLSLDVLARTLLGVPHLASWKIEGRKKGPHYVYHVVAAYKLLRDHPGDAQARKMAEDFLEMALGRPVSHARFLPQRSATPTTPEGQTSSGLLVGKVSFDAPAAPKGRAPHGKARQAGPGRPCIKPHIELLPQDYLRIGVEDQRWHHTLPVTRRTPKAGTLQLNIPPHKTPPAGTPVYLIDRREPELVQCIRAMEARLAACAGQPSRPVSGGPHLPAATGGKARRLPDMLVRAGLPQGRETRSLKGHQEGGRGTVTGLWLSPRAQDLSRTLVPRVAWWLPPVIWPDEEAALLRLIQRLRRDGARHFVCNAPWQAALFPAEGQPANGPALDLWAGPFCNVANAAHIATLKHMGFAGAFASPELPREDMLALPRQSVLPLGVVLDGFWPVGITRFGLLGIKANEPFTSPKGEVFWARQYGENVWLYPGWPLDLSEKRAELEAAGYGLFAHLQEHPPATLPEARRQSLFNWDGELL